MLVLSVHSAIVRLKILPLQDAMLMGMRKREGGGEEETGGRGRGRTAQRADR